MKSRLFLAQMEKLRAARVTGIRRIIYHLFGGLALALVAAMVGGPAWSQGAIPQTLTWQGTTNSILTLNTAYTLGATASSGLPVTLRVDSGPAIIANGTIAVSAPGTVVTAEQGGDAAYFPARLTRSFNVRQARLTPLGGFDTSSFAYSVQVVGNYAYVADFDAGLQIIDVSNPVSPARLGEYDTSGEAHRVQVVGNYAYVADFDAGLQIIDVSQPANPMRVGGYDTIGMAYGVQVAGNQAYLAVDAIWDGQDYV